MPSPRAQVLITVPVLSLLGATDEPATLDGYGPIPPSMARHLITDGADSFYRGMTDPRDGAPLEMLFCMTSSDPRSGGRAPLPQQANPSWMGQIRRAALPPGAGQHREQPRAALTAALPPVRAGRAAPPA